MFHSLKKYEHFLNDRKLYLSFGGGFFVAIAAKFFELAGIFSLDYNNYIQNGIDESTAIGYSVISIIGIAVIHEATKVMVLNHPKFFGKKDTLYYGSSLGFGFAAMYAYIVVIWALSGEELNNVEFIYAIILIIGLILLQGSFGIIIGYGSSNFKTKRFFLLTTFLHIILNIILFFRLYGEISKPISSIIVLFYGGLLYIFIYQNILPTAMTEEQRKERRRFLRKGSRN